MKKITALFLALCLAFSLAACGEGNVKEDKENNPAEVHTHSFTPSGERNFTCDKGGTIVLKCSCGEEKTEAVAPKDHTFGEWIIEKEPADNEEGKKFKTCSECGVEQVEYIPRKNLDKLFKKYESLFWDCVRFPEFSSTEEFDSSKKFNSIVMWAIFNTKATYKEDGDYHKTSDMDKLMNEYFGRTVDWTKVGPKEYNYDDTFYDKKTKSVVWASGLGGPGWEASYKGYEVIGENLYEVRWNVKDDGMGPEPVNGKVTMKVEFVNGSYRIISYNNTTQG